MSQNDPYQSGKIKNNLYALKADVPGQLAVILDGVMENRGLELIVPISRCLQQNEVHELIFTDEQEAKPGSTVNRIAYLGFFTVQRSGVIVQGDEVWVNSQCVGHLVGFDETHMPNHLNIVIKTTELLPGAQRALALGMSVNFRMNNNKEMTTNEY